MSWAPALIWLMSAIAGAGAAAAIIGAPPRNRNRRINLSAPDKRCLRGSREHEIAQLPRR